MAKRSITRRGALNRLGAVAALACAPRVLAQAPPAEAITPALMGAARREGEVHLYTAMEIAVAERYAKVFEGKFPGIRVRVERSGAERIFSRIAQEYASRIYNVDLVNTTDAAHVLAWKREGWLAPYVPADAARHYAPGHIDPEGTFATLRILFSVIAYNTALVKAEDAPEGFLDLLQPKWSGRLVKAHPGYSGLILTATHAIARELGWGYFETLARQRVMQVQSGVDPPKKVALGERAVSVDGADYIAPRRRAAHQQSQRHLQRRSKPECGAALSKLDVLRRGAAGACRSERPIRAARLRQANAWTPTACRHQGHA